MAIAIPVLERRTDTDYIETKKAEAEHNARISDNYAKLINPETKLEDALGRSVAKPTPQEILNYNIPAAESATSTVRRPYLVENARATADIFRADSAVNARPAVETALSQAVAAPRPAVAPQPVVHQSVAVSQQAAPVVSAQTAEDEESEDLRPTRTTIQYKTSQIARSEEEGKIENTGAEKHFTISKKEKVIIGVIIGVIVALFTLIIINSAIISGVNKDIANIQRSLDTVRGQYTEVDEQINEYIENIGETVEQYASENNMIKVAE